jgi:hypothetical protein
MTRTDARRRVRVDPAPPSPAGVLRLWRDHGLSIVLTLLFSIALAGQALTGWRVQNDDGRRHGEPSIGLVEYLRSGHFGEATFENFESEFLQMAFFVLLTVSLYQKGSSESKPVDAPIWETAD